MRQHPSRHLVSRVHTPPLDQSSGTLGRPPPPFPNPRPPPASSYPLDTFSAPPSRSSGTIPCPPPRSLFYSLVPTEDPPPVDPLTLFDPSASSPVVPIALAPTRLHLCTLTSTSSRKVTSVGPPSTLTFLYHCQQSWHLHRHHHQCRPGETRPPFTPPLPRPSSPSTSSFGVRM